MADLLQVKGLGVELPYSRARPEPSPIRVLVKTPMCLTRSVTGGEPDASERVLPNNTLRTRRHRDSTIAGGGHGGGARSLCRGRSGDQGTNPRRVLSDRGLSSQSGDSRPPAAAAATPSPPRPAAPV